MQNERGPERTNYNGVQPIRPEEVVRAKQELFPPEVLAAFNECIAQGILNGEATVRQGDVIEKLVLRGLERAQIYRNRWLDVEDVYREAGWKVEYDKPGYNETYEPFFKFSVPKK